MRHDPTLFEPRCRFPIWCELGSSIGSAIAGIVGAGASIFGGLSASNAAGDAADTQVRSAEIAAEVQREGLAFSQEVYDTSRADLSPWRATGGAALHTMSDMFIPGGQPVVRMQSQLNDLRARRAVMVRTGEQSMTPVQEAANGANPALASPEWWRTVRTSRQWDPGGGAGGEGGGPGGAGDAGSCCFVAGTQVLMADGTQKRIEDVEIGENVKGQRQVNTVVGFNRPKLEQRPLIAFNNSNPFTTWDHPFWDNEKRVWRCVAPEHRQNTAGLTIEPLEIGDKIATIEGDVKIVTIEKHPADPETQLYDLKLYGDHTYVADGYVVHNC